MFDLKRCSWIVMAQLNKRWLLSLLLAPALICYLTLAVFYNNQGSHAQLNADVKKVSESERQNGEEQNPMDKWREPRGVRKLL
jgi:hypothetical protein